MQLALDLHHRPDQTIMTLGDRCTFRLTEGTNKRLQRIIRVTYTVGWEMWRSRDWEAVAEEFFLDLGMALRRRRFLDVVTISPEARAKIVRKSRVAAVTKRRMS